MEQYIYNQIEFLCRNYCNNNGEKDRAAQRGQSKAA